MAIAAALLLYEARRQFFFALRLRLELIPVTYMIIKSGFLGFLSLVEDLSYMYSKHFQKGNGWLLPTLPFILTVFSFLLTHCIDCSKY